MLVVCTIIIWWVVLICGRFLSTLNLGWMLLGSVKAIFIDGYVRFGYSSNESVVAIAHSSMCGPSQKMKHRRSVKRKNANNMRRSCTCNDDVVLFLGDNVDGAKDVAEIAGSEYAGKYTIVGVEAFVHSKRGTSTLDALLEVKKISSWKEPVKSLLRLAPNAWMPWMEKA